MAGLDEARHHVQPLVAERARYLLLDRGDLPYLNWIERANCDYCGYANGLIAYAQNDFDLAERLYTQALEPEGVQ